MSDTKLKKELGFYSSIAVVIGMVIGSGVFFKPQALYTETGAPGLGMIAWILAGVITMAGGLTTAELAASITKTSGMVVWLEEAFGQMWSFLLGWVETIVFFPANIAAISIVFATQVASLLNIGDSYVPLIAIIATVFLIIMNSLGAKTGGIIQTVFTVAKLVPIAIIILFGLAKGGGGMVRLLPVTAAGHPVVSSLGAALLSCMFAYDGWIHVGNISGELKNPKKDLPKAIIGGLLVCIIAYVLINTAYLFVLPASTLANSKTPAADVVTVLFGNMGGKFITVGILISVFGALNGNILTGMRIPYAMGVENKLPGSKWLAALHPKYCTPINAGILEGVVTIIMILLGTFNQLTDMCIFVIWIFYVMSFLAVIKLRKSEPDLVRPYKVPLYPVIPAIAIIGGLYIVVNTLFTQPLNAGVGILLSLIGLPIYFSRKNSIKTFKEV